MQCGICGANCASTSTMLSMCCQTLPLKQQLESRNYRKVLGECIEEALAVMKAKNIEPAKIGKVSPKYIPTMLDLPDPVFKLVAGSMMKMDDRRALPCGRICRKSREPEIDYLNGAIVAEGIKHHVATPANAAIAIWSKTAFKEGRSPQMSGEQLLGSASDGT